MLKELATVLILCATGSAAVPPELEHATWRVRDVSAQTKFVSADQAEKLGLKLESRSEAKAGWKSSCTVIDTTGGERAVTLTLCVAVGKENWTWWDDPEKSRPATTQPIYRNVSDNAGGVENSASTYPLAVLSAGERGIVLAIPPDAQRLVRFVYDNTRHELRAEFDFGLSAIPEIFKSRADAAVISYEVPARWAFREALARYYALYPEAFVRRGTRTGIWFPFNETGSIKGAGDFGFGYHEIADVQVADVAAGRKLIEDDHRIGCGAYLYVEPQTYWQHYKGQGKGTFEQRLAQLEADAKGGDGISQATLVSGLIRSTGKRDLYMEGVAYTDQLPWGSDANPAIPDDAKTHWPSKARYEFDRVERIMGWRAERPDIGVDGVYVDSSEGWGEILNYNKEHWRVAQYPLTFDPRTKKVALLNFWGTVAWVKEMSRRLHDHGKILMANDAYFRRWQLFPYVDVPGREYTWIEDGKFAPVPDERYLFFRAMSAKRPYCMLMNNRYDLGEFIEPYFQRSLFYAVYPSMYFGHTSATEVWYFANPAWYERDRQLFKKYVPLIHKLDEAGWEPVPYATAEPKEIRIERYGRFADGNLAFAIHNPMDRKQEVRLKLMRDELRLPRKVSAAEWVSGRGVLAAADDEGITLSVDVPAKGYAVLGIEVGGGY